MNRRDFLRAVGVVSALPVTGLTLKMAPSNPTILDMADSGQLGMSMSLFPVQRFILKMMYGLELDPSEREYLALLQSEGRYIPAREGSREAMLVTGRRSGMSYLGQVVQLYELSRLLQHPVRDPLAQFGSVLSVSCDRETTTGLLKDFLPSVSRSTFGSHLKSTAMSRACFEDVNGRKIIAQYRSSNTKTIRGIRASSIVLDNAAFYEDPQQIYYTVAPYQGRLTTTTTSNGSETFQDFYAKAVARGALVMRIPTWEANPLLPRKYSYLVSQQNSLGARDFGLEYGAEV